MKEQQSGHSINAEIVGDARRAEVVALVSDLAKLRPDDPGWVNGFLYVVSAPSPHRDEWHNTIVRTARSLNFMAVAGYEIEPLVSMSPLNVAHLLIARADAILFDITDITPGIAYQIGFAYAIGNVSQDVVVVKCADDVIVRQILCPYEVVPYAVRNLGSVLNGELNRLLKVRPYLRVHSEHRSEAPTPEESSVPIT